MTKGLIFVLWTGIASREVRKEIGVPHWHCIVHNASTQARVHCLQWANHFNVGACGGVVMAYVGKKACMWSCNIAWPWDAVNFVICPNLTSSVKVGTLSLTSRRRTVNVAGVDLISGPVPPWSEATTVTYATDKGTSLNHCYWIQRLLQ